jgi:hypothetical protein
MADPVSVRNLEDKQFPNAGVKWMIQTQVAQSLARSDPTQAEEVAVAIEEPAGRCSALVAVVDALPERERDHKLALLDDAALQAKAATNSLVRLDRIGKVAERWYELGETEKAKTLFAE